MKTLLLCSMFLIASGKQTKNSIYEHKVPSLKGTVIDFNDFRGKKIMIVNISSGSTRNTQMQQLNTLCRLYADSNFIVIAFPSNDFKNEARSNNELESLYNNLQPNFLIAGKSLVKGENASPVYKWLTQKNKNGVLDTEVTGDFQKFLISGNGKIIAVYSGIVNPLNALITNALNAN